MSSESSKLYNPVPGLKSLFNKGDATFLFGDDKKVNAFKIVLTSVSPVFDSMFFGDLKKSSHVKVVDISYEVFSSMIKLIHGYEINELDSGVLVDALVAVDKYQIDSLKNDLSKYLQDNLNLKLSIAVAVFDRMIELNRMGLFRLIERVKEVIFLNCTTIIYDKLHFQLSESALVSILNFKLEMWEMDLIYEISEWIDAKLEREGLQVNRFNKQEAFIPFKPFVRFCDLTISEFVRGKIVLDDLLTREEICNILCHLVDETFQLNIKYEGDRNGVQSWLYCDAETISLPLGVTSSETVLRPDRKAFIKSIRTNILAEVGNLKCKIFESKNGRQQEIEDLIITNSLVANKWQIEFPHLLEMIPKSSYRIKFEFTNSSTNPTFNMFPVDPDNGQFTINVPKYEKNQLSFTGKEYHCIERINFRYVPRWERQRVHCHSLPKT